MTTPTVYDESTLVALLPEYLARVFDVQSVVVTSACRLTGGAIQENWRLSLKLQDSPNAQQDVVLRTDAPSGLLTSRSRIEEFAILKAAWNGGVMVPRPIAIEETGKVIGRPFFLSAAVSGTALGTKIVRDTIENGNLDRLAESLAEQLARIHSINPAVDLQLILGRKPDDVIDATIDRYRQDIDQVSRPSPTVEFALRVLELERPNASEAAFCHRDYRTGNYLVDGGILTAILDWEFAGWSDPYEDIGWFCAKNWRFGADDRPAGGLVSRDHFFDSYSKFAGRVIDRKIATWWELMANVRWAVIAHQQSDRLINGGERSLELAMIARRIGETEHEILALLKDTKMLAA